MAQNTFEVKPVTPLSNEEYDLLGKAFDENLEQGRVIGTQDIEPPETA